MTDAWVNINGTTVHFGTAYYGNIEEGFGGGQHLAYGYSNLGGFEELRADHYGFNGSVALPYSHAINPAQCPFQACGEFKLRNPLGGFTAFGRFNPTFVTVDFAPLGGVPEPATWTMMIMGFGLAGARLRRLRVAD